MAFSYHTWAELTGSARLEMLRDHISEVSQAISSNQSMSVDGRSMSKYDLMGYLTNTLIPEERRLSRIVDAAGDSDHGGMGITTVRLWGMN